MNLLEMDVLLDVCCFEKSVLYENQYFEDHIVDQKSIANQERQFQIKNRYKECHCNNIEYHIEQNYNMFALLSYLLKYFDFSSVVENCTIVLSFFIITISKKVQCNVLTRYNRISYKT
jgi:hypothetical protein